MVEGTNQQGLASATMPLLWKHSPFTQEMIGTLAAAQLQHRITHNLSLKTIQCISLTPTIKVIVIIGYQKNIESCFKLWLCQPLLEVGLAHHTYVIGLCRKLLYMYEGRDISLPVVSNPHEL